MDKQEIESYLRKLNRELQCLKNKICNCCNPSGDITFSNGLTKTLSVVRLGGTLDEDTTINTNGNDFKLIEDVQSDISAGIYDNIFSNNRSFNIDHTDGDYTFSYFNKGENLPVGSSDYDIEALSVINNSNGDFSFNGVSKNVSTGDLYSQLAWTDNATTTNQLRVGEVGIEVYIIDDPAFIVNTDKDLIAPNYPNTRNDSATTPPINVIYTDADGNFLSTPVFRLLMTGIGTYANDAAAAAGGVPIDGLYKQTGTGYLVVRTV